jgi:hypothetical protein
MAAIDACMREVNIIDLTIVLEKHDFFIDVQFCTILLALV